MSKKILTVLAPVAAIVAFMALPALAQATQVQCGGSECANGATIRGQSSNLVTTTNEGATISCTGSTFTGTVTNNQGETIQGSITSDTLSGCSTKGLTAHITTNASAANPWSLHVQQPEHQGEGAGQHEQVTAHLKPASGKKIEFQVQVQFFGFSVAHCTFATHAADESIQLMGEAQSDTMSVEGSNQFQLVGSNSSECGTVGTTEGTLTGSFQTETSTGAAVVVHMS